jgi:hypothetical protein
VQCREYRFGITRIVLDSLVFSVWSNEFGGNEPGFETECLHRTPQLWAELHASIATTVPVGKVRNHFKNSPLFNIDDRLP